MTLPRALPPIETPTSPIRALPNGACDAHVHMVGDDFALWNGRVEDPAAGNLDDWLRTFKEQCETLGVNRTLLVHSILYGPDNSITLEAARRLGPEVARVVALVPDDVDDSTLDDLAAAQTVAVRLNYVHGGILSWEGVCNMAPRLAARGMHIQMLLHTHKHMVELADDIHALPVPVVIDHIGWPDMDLGVTDAGFQTLLALMAEGHVYTKLSASYRMTGAPYETAAPYLRALMDANIDRCLWGSDWPHLMLGGVDQPDAGVLLNHLLGQMDADETAAVLVRNPETLFGF